MEEDNAAMNNEEEAEDPGPIDEENVAESNRDEVAAPQNTPRRSWN